MKKTFPDIIRRGKAIDFLATVGMSTDGIAYNHYGIKYVLKRLEDQRQHTHGGGGRTKRWRLGRESGRARHTHTQMEKQINGVCVRGMRSRDSASSHRPPWLLIIIHIGSIGDFPDETQL